MVRSARWHAVLAVAAFLLAGCLQPVDESEDGPYFDGSAFLVSNTLIFEEGEALHMAPNGAEPGAKAAPDGTLYVVAWTSLHRSTDGGTTWNALETPFTHHGDSDMAITPDGTLHFVGMPLQSQDGPRLPYYLSTDRGDSWTLVEDLGRPGDSIDRQWIAADSRGRLVLTWNDIDSDENLVRVSHDAGATWSAITSLASPRYKVPGVPVWRGDQIIQPLSRFSGIDFAVSDDAGASWRIVPGPDLPVTGFPGLAVDRAGTLYLVATRHQDQAERAVVLWTTEDVTASWGAPSRLHGQDEGVLPWVVAGQPGNVAVAFYRSEVSADPRNPVEQLVQPAPPATTWHVEVYLAAGLNQPGPVRVAADVHRGDICTNGAGCAPEDWVFKDYFEMEVTPGGDLFLAHMRDAEDGAAAGYEVVASLSHRG